MNIIDLTNDTNKNSKIQPLKYDDQIIIIGEQEKDEKSITRDSRISRNNHEFSHKEQEIIEISDDSPFMKSSRFEKDPDFQPKLSNRKPVKLRQQKITIPQIQKKVSSVFMKDSKTEIIDSFGKIKKTKNIFKQNEVSSSHVDKRKKLLKIDDSAELLMECMDEEPTPLQLAYTQILMKNNTNANKEVNQMKEMQNKQVVIIVNKEEKEAADLAFVAANKLKTTEEIFLRDNSSPVLVEINGKAPNKLCNNKTLKLKCDSKDLDEYSNEFDQLYIAPKIRKGRRLNDFDSNGDIPIKENIVSLIKKNNEDKVFKSTCLSSSNFSNKPIVNDNNSKSKLSWYSNVNKKHNIISCSINLIKFNEKSNSKYIDGSLTFAKADTYLPDPKIHKENTMGISKKCSLDQKKVKGNKLIDYKKIKLSPNDTNVVTTRSNKLNLRSNDNKSSRKIICSSSKASKFNFKNEKHYINTKSSNNLSYKSNLLSLVCSKNTSNILNSNINTFDKMHIIESIEIKKMQNDNSKNKSKAKVFKYGINKLIQDKIQSNVSNSMILNKFNNTSVSKKKSHNFNSIKRKAENSSQSNKCNLIDRSRTKSKNRNSFTKGEINCNITKELKDILNIQKEIKKLDKDYKDLMSNEEILNNRKNDKTSKISNFLRIMQEENTKDLHSNENNNLSVNQVLVNKKNLNNNTESVNVEPYISDDNVCFENSVDDLAVHVFLDDYYYGTKNGNFIPFDEINIFIFKCHKCKLNLKSNMDLFEHIRQHIQEEIQENKEIPKKIEQEFNVKHQDKSKRNSFNILSKKNETIENFIRNDILCYILDISLNKCNSVLKFNENVRDKINDGDDVIKNLICLDKMLESSEIEKLPFKQYWCNQCYMIFNKTDEAQQHQNIHCKFTSCAFICRICEIHFSSSCSLLEHMRLLHQPSEMPYICEICDFRSSIFNLLIKHFNKSHKNLNTLMCPYCLKYFFSLKKTKNCFTKIFYDHLLMHYDKEKTIKCKRCRLIFVNQDELEDHEVRAHFSNYCGIKCKLILETCDNQYNPVVIKLKKPGLLSLNMNSSLLNFNEIKFFGVKDFPCLECGHLLNEPHHFKFNTRCELCSYSTACNKAYFDHTQYVHCSLQKMIAPFLRMNKNLIYRLYCKCGYHCIHTANMIDHIVLCGKFEVSTKPYVSLIRQVVSQDSIAQKIHHKNTNLPNKINLKIGEQMMDTIIFSVIDSIFPAESAAEIAINIILDKVLLKVSENKKVNLINFKRKRKASAIVDSIFDNEIDHIVKCGKFEVNTQPYVSLVKQDESKFPVAKTIQHKNYKSHSKINLKICEQMMDEIIFSVIDAIFPAKSAVENLINIILDKVLLKVSKNKENLRNIKRKRNTSIIGTNFCNNLVQLRNIKEINCNI